MFHNLRGYDSHFIIQEICNFDKSMNVVPNAIERYMAFMTGKRWVFNDSIQFMNWGLESVVENLGETKFINFLKNFKEMK